MTVPFLDISVIIRLLTGDDPDKQTRAQAFFERIERGELTVQAPATVIADAVYVLASKRLYNLPREHGAALLAPLVRLPGFHMQGRRAVLGALQLYVTTSGLDFGHALIAASAQRSGVSVVYSHDTDFVRIPGITREEP
jgi:predicted nucleic acid-binding protein